MSLPLPATEAPANGCISFDLPHHILALLRPHGGLCVKTGYDDGGCCAALNANTLETALLCTSAAIVCLNHV